MNQSASPSAYYFTSFFYFDYSRSNGMGWDILWVLVSPPLKRLLKGPPPSFPGFPPLGRQGYSKKQSSPRSRVYRRVHTDRSDPNYDIKILHRKLLEITEGGSCSNPQKVEFARVHRSRKVLKSTEEGRCSSPQKEEGVRVHNWAVVAESCSKGPERQHKL